MTPAAQAEYEPIPHRLYAAVIALLAAEFEAVVLHLPRGQSDIVRRGIELSDQVLLVLTLDLLSLYGARRAISGLSLAERGVGPRVVVNRLAKAELMPRDVERVLGIPVWTAIHSDPAVKRAQDRGELLPQRSRKAGRDVRRLCRKLADAQRTREGS